MMPFSAFMVIPIGITQEGMNDIFVSLQKWWVCWGRKILKKLLNEVFAALKRV